MKKQLAVAAAQIARHTSRLSGRGDGSALPGLIAEKIDGAILAKLGKMLSEGSVLITGTNGKTTTAKMVREILTASGYNVVANTAGSNLQRGIISSLIAARPGARQIGIFEVDEAAMPDVAMALQPKLIIVLNLFRDQLDRYGELDTTARLIGKAIASSQADVWLNADDPLVASLGSHANSGQAVHYFGASVEYQSKLKHDHTADSLTDPKSGRKLEYSRKYFGHIGHYDGRPEPVVNLVKFDATPDASDITISSVKAEIKARLAIAGFYNAYNALAATATGLALGCKPDIITQVLESTTAAYGRIEHFNLLDRRVVLLLIKNPTGLNQVIESFLLQKSQQNILFIINDNYADGRDVSWLWDSAIEDLPNYGHNYLCAGTRKYDMALRLKYAGLTSNTTEGDTLAALKAKLGSMPANEVLYVLATYTAMTVLRKQLAQLVGRGRAGEDK